MKMCMDCRFYTVGGISTCSHPDAARSLVAGSLITPCLFARAGDGICKPEGRLWQPKADAIDKADAEPSGSDVSAEMPISEVMSGLTVNVSVTGIRRHRLRVGLGLFIMRLAVLVMGCGLTVER